MKTEKELHQEFLKLGANRRKLTNELLALLPEIYDRKIYLKYASSIVEYAGKFGGLSKGVVIKRLRLEKYLSDKPKLRDAIKTEGVHKVALVASVVTSETEEAWVDKLKNMSKNAIQELSKEVRNKEIEASGGGFFEEGSLFVGLDKAKNGTFMDEHSQNHKQMSEISAPCKATSLKIMIELTDETAFLFLKLKKKVESSTGRFLNNKEAMNEILKRLADAEFSGKVILEDDFRDGKITDEQVEENRTEIPKSSTKISRYIPVYVKKMAISSTQGKCAYPNCGHPAEIFHHRERFAERKKRLDYQENIHQSVISLCKIHHEFAHNGIIANESQDVGQWGLKINENNLSKSDISYREVRLEALR